MKKFFSPGHRSLNFKIMKPVGKEHSTVFCFITNILIGLSKIDQPIQKALT